MNPDLRQVSTPPEDQLKASGSGRRVAGLSAAAGWALLAALFLGTALTSVSCVKRTVKSTRQKITIVGEEESIGKKLNDQQEAFNDKRRSEYESRAFDPGGKEQGKESFRNARIIDKRQYRQPEYLERQQFDAKEAKTKTAREADFDNFRAAEAGQKARTKDTGLIDRILPGKWFQGSDKEYRTSTYREAADAQAQAPNANLAPVIDPITQEYREGNLEMDEVKKLLNPGAY